MKRLHTLALLLSLLLLAACSQPETKAANLIEFKVIGHGHSSGITFKKFFEISNAQDFKDFWTIHSQPSHAAEPKIDFEQETVIAVFYGQTQTGGYDIYIHSIEELEAERVVHVFAVDPVPGSIRTMMISQPNMIVSLPKAEKPLRFVAKKRQ